jgi:hypothetical protein
MHAGTSDVNAFECSSRRRKQREKGEVSYTGVPEQMFWCRLRRRGGAPYIGAGEARFVEPGHPWRSECQPAIDVQL